MIIPESITKKKSHGYRRLLAVKKISESLNYDSVCFRKCKMVEDNKEYKNQKA